MQKECLVVTRSSLACCTCFSPSKIISYICLYSFKCPETICTSFSPKFIHVILVTCTNSCTLNLCMYPISIMVLLNCRVNLLISHVTSLLYILTNEISLYICPQKVQFCNVIGYILKIIAKTSDLQFKENMQFTNKFISVHLHDDKFGIFLMLRCLLIQYLNHVCRVQ